MHVASAAGMPWALIADDDALLRESVADCLGGIGWSVREAGDGQGAIRVLMGQRMDLLVSDVDMPDMTGFALVDWVAAHQPGPRVILMSARADARLASAANGIGAIALLAKPFPTARLTSLVTGAFPL